jgi:hypothetical protein
MTFEGLLCSIFGLIEKKLNFHGKRQKKRDQKKRRKKTHLIPYSLIMIGKLRPLLGTYPVGLRS